MIKKIVFFLFIIYFAFFSKSTLTFAEDTPTCNNNDECQQKIDEYVKKLNELGNAKNTLANQIALINSQINLTFLKISQTENSIKSLEKEIAGLTVEIGKLDVNLNQLSSVYVLQIVQNYKLEKKIPPFAFLISSKLNNFLAQYKYVANAQKASQNSLVKMETVRSNYDAQKTAKATKQAEMETLQKTLASQKISLNSQKITKNQLLESTKNDEKKYQQLLSAVQSKLASFNNSSTENGCLGSPAGGGSDGNYYSQIDSRWCKQYIGAQRRYTIGGAGCYLTSMSMVFKKIGYDITPSVYAADPSRFTSTADLVAPSPPSGYTYKCMSINSKYGCETSSRDNILSRIDSEIKAGRYAIVQVPMQGSPSGYHFIVIISGSNGNYKIHDPAFGADKDFNQRYSTGGIISLRLITK